MPIQLNPIQDPTKIEWEYATSVERGRLWVKNLSQSLGLTERQVDELFILGDTL